MQWLDQAIIISIKKFGEKSAILNLLTKNHGLHKGVIRNITTKTAISTYQIGNKVEASWKARLSEHIGSFNLELVEPIVAYFFDERLKLSALLSACSLIDNSLAERHYEKAIYEKFTLLIDKLKRSDNWQQEYVEFEMLLLSELGFGIDLEQCAATGVTKDLIYVSPKSSRAVSRAAGDAYKDKLLKLPAFLHLGRDEANSEEILQGLTLTGYFLGKSFYDRNKTLPSSRSRMIELLKEQFLIC
jgi:DNA repair protein RecO (recombination protein O)